MSLATACLALGPYAGEETGETTLLRQLLAASSAGDLAVMDRYYCSFLMIALLLGQQVQERFGRQPAMWEADQSAPDSPRRAPPWLTLRRSAEPKTMNNHERQ
jgi:hypothetical protein